MPNQLHGKKYRAAEKNRDVAAAYMPRQALEIVKKSSFAKFDETVEVAVRLGVDPKHADQVVRGTVVLPAGTGKSVTSTGRIIPACCDVRELNSFTNAMMLIPWGPSAVPTGGAGVACPAGICSFTNPVTFLAMSTLSTSSLPLGA